jgi:hypothetical protein
MANSIVAEFANLNQSGIGLTGKLKRLAQIAHSVLL